MKSFSKSKILCVGDIILDTYIQGKVERISPEAPIPVFKLGDERFVLGGAANVARNICAGGGSCYLISVVGQDEDSRILNKLIKQERNLSVKLLKIKNRKTTKKQRYISGQQQVLRIDNETNNEISIEHEKIIFEHFKDLIENFDVVVISDYNKGLLTYNLVQKLILLAKKHKKPIVVDPKRDSFEIYKGATIITPNYKELMKANKDCFLNTTTETRKIEIFSRDLIKKYRLNSVITTRSFNGLSVITKNKKAITLSSEALEVFDVSGAGDTVVAYLSLGISAGLSIEKSAALANKAAGISVGKFGTASVYFSEVLNYNNQTSKLFSINEAKIKLKTFKEKKIGFTNGCFDLIHSGHINYLIKTKEYCDFLILGLNSDSSIRKLKGNDRPICLEDERLTILSNFSFIDMLILFSDETPLKLIKAIKPDLIFKGGDYAVEDVVGNKEIKLWGGQVKILRYEKGKSTSNLIKRMRK